MPTDDVIGGGQARYAKAGAFDLGDPTAILVPLLLREPAPVTPSCSS